MMNDSPAGKKMARRTRLAVAQNPAQHPDANNYAGQQKQREYNPDGIVEVLPQIAEQLEQYPKKFISVGMHKIPDIV